MTTFQQQARFRKLVYTVLILALFTASLLHRRLVIEAKARDLQLREVDRGEVELTASAVRLLLTGSRGMAVTMLWWEVDKKFTKHKWNEVELLVSSITELQPYFITPWLFQSHNLAFNISVENDRPRDKYYYISRGLDRLAAGERRNSNPGNPDLRYHMGLFLQMKIGTSDEKVTMRCLLDLSSIDPVERSDSRPYFVIELGKKNLSPKFAQFCKDNPRLIRRLREQLGYDSTQVVSFLEEHREIPHRFSDSKTAEGKSALKDAKEQWPILPPADKIRDSVGGYTIPNRLTPTKTDFGISGESMDIFILSRTWFMYAQESLPPPPAIPGLESTDRRTYDPTVHRVPKRPNVYIFRRTPAQAAANHAEALQEEGWYDDKGWFIRDWFTGSVVADPAMGLPVGEKIEFHSARAWALSHKMHKDYGRFNNIYQDLAEKRRLETLANEFRKKSVPPLGPHDPPPSESSVSADRMPGYVALRKLHYGNQYRSMVNYDAHIYESLGKGSRDAIMAFKLFTLAEPLRKGGDSSMIFYEKTAAGNYEKRVMPLIDAYNLAVELMLNVLLDSPGVRKVSTLQDEIYDYEIRYIRYAQNVYGDKLLKPLTVGMAQSSMLLRPPFVYKDQKTDKFWKPLQLGMLPSSMVLNLPFTYKDQKTDTFWKPLQLGMLQSSLLLRPPFMNDKQQTDKLWKPLTLGMAQSSLLLHPPLHKLLTDQQEQKLFPLRNFGGLLTEAQQNQLFPLRSFGGLLNEVEQNKFFPLRNFGGLLTVEQRNKFHPIRDFRGPFDMTVAPDFKHPERDKSAWEDEEEQTLKMVLLAWSQGTKPYLLLHPGLQPRMLSTVTPRGAVLPPNWAPLVSEYAVNAVRMRYRGLPSLKAEQEKPNQ